MNRARSSRRRAPRWLVGLALFAAVVASATKVAAHPTPGSVAFVDFTVDGARIEQDVPIEELERALHRRLAEEGESPEAIVRRHGELLRSYAGVHLRAMSVGSDAPWRAEVLAVTGHAAADGPRARFRFALRAPAGQASRSVRLHDAIVAHEVISHYTTIYLRSDWAVGVATTEPQLAGTIHAGHNEITIVRHGSFWRGLYGVVALGIEHIVAGSDHLMFLFALVLVAPVSAAGGRWRAGRGTRATLLGLARVVSAFTVGHSATLVLGAFGWVVLPSAAIEAAIAASVLTTAGHAVRPIFPSRESSLAGAFGLVHGLAFANTLAGRELGRAQAAWTLLGFNTGIELAQLALLFLVVPWLLILARTRAYAPFRVAAATFAAVLATGWLLERTTALPNPTARPLAWMEAHASLLLVALAVAALLARAADRKGRAPMDVGPTGELHGHLSLHSKL